MNVLTYLNSYYPHFLFFQLCMESPNVYLILLTSSISHKVMLYTIATFVMQKNTTMSRLSEHNKEIKASAKYRAEEMKTWPSPLEERMKNFLDKNCINYEFQKIFYICDKDGWIIRYYIADFYIPEKDIIIEVDGKFHNNQVQKDKNRTKVIQEHYPEIEVLRFAWEDLKDEDTMEGLLWELV